MIDYKVFTEGLFQTNCTVLQKNGNCIVVDVPYGSDNLTEYILQNNLKLQAVLLTHGHFDHCGGVKSLLKNCDASDGPIYVHKNDFELCKNAEHNLWGVPCENCCPTHSVAEGGLNIGDFHFDVLETSGHTSGSVVYLTENLVLSGDTLFCDGIGRTDFAESRPEYMSKSLQKLCALSGDYTVISGHGSLTTLDREKKNNPYLRCYLKK